MLKSIISVYTLIIHTFDKVFETMLQSAGDECKKIINIMQRSVNIKG